MNAEILGLYICVLAAFIGYEVITKVPAQLHTPLMSGANAISGVILIGGIIVTAQAGDAGNQPIALILGLLGILLATINVVGGFMVTDRMLHMFKRKKEPDASASPKDGGAA